MKLKILILLCLVVTSNGIKSKKSFKPKLINFVLKYFFKLLKFIFVRNKPQLLQIVPYNGIPKEFIIEEAPLKTQKGVTTWPLDYFLIKDSVPKNLLKFVLTVFIFKKVLTFIGLLILMFFVPAALTSSDKKEEEEARKLNENVYNLKELEEMYKNFKKSLNKFQY